jgi:hypothetical protein
MSTPTEETAFRECFQKPGKKKATSTCMIAGLYGARFSGGVIVWGRAKKGAIGSATLSGPECSDRAHGIRGIFLRGRSGSAGRSVLVFFHQTE